MASITLDGVQKTYPNGHVAVRGIDLEIADGEFVVLVGPSGCGKSTTLRMVAGLETPTGGRILLGGEDVTDRLPQDRDIAMVFQTYALYPHKTVEENLAFPLRMRGVSKDAVEQRVAEAARILGLEQFLASKPRQLSGGQRQRVALGRAIVRDPKAFLLDEPLSNLDAKLRVQTRAELARMHRQLGATMMYVTHDQEEAMTLGDRVAVMHEGVLQQIAPPMEVYRHPANAFVAAFIGSPAMNFFPGVLRRREGTCLVECAGFVAPIGVVALSEDSPSEVSLGVRPHDIDLVAAAEAHVMATIDVVEPLGSELLVHLLLMTEEKGQTVRVVVSPDVTVREGEPAGLRFRLDRLHVFERDGGRRLNPKSEQ